MMKYFKLKLFFVFALFILSIRTFHTQVMNPTSFGLALSTFFGLMFVGYIYSFKNKVDEFTEHQMIISFLVGIMVLCVEFYLIWIYIWKVTV